MDKEEINANHKKFLEYYAKTLNARQSAQLAGYKSENGISSVKKILDNPKKVFELEKIIAKSISKLEVTKAFVVKKYLKIIEYAFFEDENGLKDPQLGLRALDGLCKQLTNPKNEDIKQQKTIFENIEGLDPDKI